jgi:hypothetical protein
MRPELQLLIAKLLDVYVNELHIDPLEDSFDNTCRKFCKAAIEPIIAGSGEPYPEALVNEMIAETVERRRLLQ